VGTVICDVAITKRLEIGHGGTFGVLTMDNQQTKSVGGGNNMIESFKGDIDE
jgi:hypothetical protein